jgi:hypothetical protein
MGVIVEDGLRESRSVCVCGEMISEHVTEEKCGAALAWPENEVLYHLGSMGKGCAAGA